MKLQYAKYSVWRSVAVVALERWDTHRISTRLDIEELKTRRWATGKEAVEAIKDIAFGEGKSVFVANRGGTFRRINCRSEVSGCNWSVTLAQLRPFEFFKAYATILMGERHARLKLCENWTKSGRATTPRAEKKVQAQLKQATEYSVVISTDDVAFVAHVKSPLTQRRVNITTRECLCDTWKQHKIPCRHMLSAMAAVTSIISAFSLVGACYAVESYQSGMGTMEIAEDRALVPDQRILPATFIRQAGRPRKRRIRSRGETTGSGSARKPYKCGRCGKSDGHNKATCHARSP